MPTPPSSEALAAAQEQLASKLIAATEQFLAPHRARLDCVLGVVAQAHGLCPQALAREGKTRALMAAKREAVMLAVEFLSPPLSPETIGGWLNLSRTTVYRLLADVRQRAATDPTFAAHLDTLRERIRTALQLNTEDKPNG